MYVTRSSSTEREAKLDAVHEQLVAAVGALTTDVDWRRALEFAGRFTSRSFSNTMLIYVQHAAAFEARAVPDPVPTYVAGYRQWQSLGRQVRRGQHGYVILAPVTQRLVATNPETGPWRRLEPGERAAAGETQRSRLVGVRPATVFDVSQTDGDPLPEPPTPHLLVGQAPAGLWEGLARQVTDRGFAVRQVPDAVAIGGANGLTDYREHSVSVRADMDAAARVKTLAHELGHVLLHGPDNPDGVGHRGIAEVEAESVALMIGAAHGLDTSTYTVPYVTTWASSVEGKTPVDVVIETADRVRKAAVSILDRLDTVQVGNGEPPGLHAAPKQPQPEVATPDRVPARSGADL